MNEASFAYTWPARAGALCNLSAKMDIGALLWLSKLQVINGSGWPDMSAAEKA